MAQDRSQTPTLDIVKVFGSSKSTERLVLLFGGESEMGRCLLEKMIRDGFHVQAIVSDVDKARMLLGNLERSQENTLELVQWKEGMPVSLQVSQGTSVLICDALTPYRTWIENLGMIEKNIYNPSNGVEAMSWGPLDDVVMGGCSQSQLSIQQGKGEENDYAAVFSGNITSANNGGFASVRTKNLEPPLDFSEYDGIKLRIKGDKQRYKFMLRTSANWDGICFCKSFDTIPGWQDVHLPFEDFIPVFRARSVKPPPPFNLKLISSLQIMLSKFEYDGKLNPNIQMGRFELPIQNIQLYKKAVHLILVGGSSEEKDFIKGIKGTYTIIEPESDQTRLKDSTLESFCLASLSENGAINKVFREKQRAFGANLTFNELLEYFDIVD